MILLVDNYDSFVFNIARYVEELGHEVEVERNDRIDVDSILACGTTGLIISPGPRTPAEAGISTEAVRKLSGKIPILGICLGHQCIGAVFGGDVVRARQVMHGKTSMIHHVDSGLFDGLPMPFEATRYHSLIVARDSLPADLEVTGWTQHEDGTVDEIMGLRHRTLPIEGVQFHPESILTLCGSDLLRNFLQRSAVAA
jgi:anthranilate synthase component 2